MHHRHAFTLLELIVSLASSIILVAGLAGSLYISNKAIDGSSSARESLTASTVLRDLMADVSQASSFSERTPRSITFTVPDRDGDEAPEVIRYAWSGVVGDPLTYQYNGSAAVAVATNVQAFHLSALTREITVDSISAPVAPGVVFEGFTERAVTNTAQVVINKPPGTSEGDLLIACVVTDGGTVLSNPTGWNQVDIGSNTWNNGTNNLATAVTFGVWWKQATASDSSTSTYQFTRNNTSRKAYGWIMRFTGHDATNPINASNSARGGATTTPPNSPPSPAVITSVANAMILRLGGFDDPDITVGNPGAGIGTPITMNYSSNSGSGQCSGGAGYVIQASAGNSGPSNFTLAGPEEYVTVTIAISPDTPE